MGKKKYLGEIEALFKKSPVVDSASILRIIRNRKKVSQYNKQLIRNLLLAGKIKKLAKGCYTMHDDPSLAVFCFNPAYLGLQDALSMNNLWEQETIPVIITPRKVRQGIRSIMGTNVLIRRIDKRYFFGYEHKNYGDFYFPVSDIEKTFIDMVYFNEKLDKRILANIRDSLDKKKLASYLKRYPERIRRKLKSAWKDKSLRNI